MLIGLMGLGGFNVFLTPMWFSITGANDSCNFENRVSANPPL